MRRIRVALIWIFVITGCSSKDTAVRDAPVPKYDTDAITQSVMSDFDKNRDGSLDTTELRACPALYGALAAIDTNGDKRLSKDEIRKRVEAYASGTTGSIAVTCTVRLDGEPLTDATVTFDPEPCMAEALKPANAKTNNSGQCTEYQIDGKTYSGLAAGLYRIRVTKDGASIPPRFNTQSILGQEVFDNPRVAELTVEMDLASR
jgi:EF hand